jgi:tetratricopeptide (TPR) repeat protein
VLNDPTWGGRAHYARALANSTLGLTDAAAADYERAALTADSLWFRSEAHRELAVILAKRGQFALAPDHLRMCLRSYPLRKDDLDIRLEIVRNLHTSGDYLGASQEALALELDAQNAPSRYLPQAVAVITAACDAILDDCSAALRTAETKPRTPLWGGGAVP